MLVDGGATTEVVAGGTATVVDGVAHVEVK